MVQDIVTSLAPLAKYAKYVAYQLLGIYFPAASLLVYLLILWGQNFEVIDKNVLLNDNLYGKLIVFVIFTILIGESINALSSRYTTISPVSTSFTEKANYLFRRVQIPSLLISKIGTREWPTWLNETHYPVSLDAFDRYFLLRVDSQKKPIAGRLGWLAFYRNFFSVFILVFSLNALVLLLRFQEMGISRPPDPILDLTLMLSGILSIVFYFGYRAQNNANSSVLWNAYRRNELTKSLEAKYGDLPLALGIEDKFKGQALDYITDRWFLAVESAIKVVSSVIYSEAERAYERLKATGSRDAKKPDQKDVTDIKHWAREVVNLLRRGIEEDKVTRRLVRAASAWHDGEYETVINICLKVLDSISDFSGIPKSIDSDFWKFIKGFYLFEDELYTTEAISEIQSNVNRWKWVYDLPTNGKNSAEHEIIDAVGSAFKQGGIHSSRISIYKPGSRLKDLMWESGDPFSRCSSVISKAINEFDDCRQQLGFDEDEICLNFIKCIVTHFGGFEYQQAILKANTLILELHAKREHVKNKEEYSVMLKCEKHSFDIRANEHMVTDKIGTPLSSNESETARAITPISVHYPVKVPINYS